MNNHETQDRSGIYKIGAVSAVIIVLVYLTELVVVVIYGLPPVTVEGWFTSFQNNRLVGLIQSFALDIIAVSFHVPLYIALFFFLRQTKKVNSMLCFSPGRGLMKFLLHSGALLNFGLVLPTDGILFY